jgi:hypothetical protein
VPWPTVERVSNLAHGAPNSNSTLHTQSRRQGELVVRTRNKQEPKAPARNWIRMVQFGKLDCSVSSALAAVRSTVGSSEGILFPARWRLTKRKNKIHNNFGG